MFTGIIESEGRIEKVQTEGTNRHFLITSAISKELKVDQSVSHDGVCLTVTRVEDGAYWVTAIEETLQKTNLARWDKGVTVNIERSMPANGRFDGHIVQGHVDQTATVTSIQDQNGSWLFEFQYESIGHMTVEKGSIAVNGVSLTCFKSQPGKFTVAIIPYTFEHTNFGRLKTGDTVNLEFDIVGKYVSELVRRK
jgi:riboflavin synthase